MGRNRWKVPLTGFHKNINMNKFGLVIFAVGFSQIHADGDMRMDSDSTTFPSSIESNGFDEDNGYGSGYGDGYGSGNGVDGYESGFEDGDDYECCLKKYVESLDPKMSGVYVYWGKSENVPWFCNSQCVYVKEDDYNEEDMDMGGVQNFCFKPSDSTRSICDDDDMGGFSSGSGYGSEDSYGSGYGESYGDGYGTTEGTTMMNHS